MSRKKHQALRGERSANLGRRPRLAGRLPWIVLATIMIIAVWWFSRRGDVPVLPEIATSQLDSSSARRIEERLNEVRSAPRSGAAWGELGVLLKSFEFRAEARRCFDTAERLDAKDPRWPYFHGLMLTAESPATAIEKLRRAVSLCGSEPETPRLRLARLLAEGGKTDDAVHQLRELLRDKPHYAPAILALALLMQARGELTNAVSLANRCTSDRRTARASWSLLAMLHQRLGDTNAALSTSQRATAAPPDIAEADPFEGGLPNARADARDLSDRAQRFLMSGQLKEASLLVEQLVREHPQFAESWLLLGRLQVLQRQLAPAEQSLRRHLQLDPESINGHFQLGMALLAQERFDEAIEAFHRATRLKTDFGPGFFHLGMSLARSGKQREAIGPFREAIRHNPERVDSYILLADLLLQLGQPAEAKELTRQAELLNPNDRRLAMLREKLALQP